ncbi:PfkB family carbohydrate kinase [Edwardsiella anguillarum]|uniref:PfkB family carbohydrate kinase n=1 Tax=Edwardsiella anguillarum TaxID=1821960 RepID=UPI0024B835B2|nr:PfkB family carbohydrate kinase [Edwardsiella anguillarum]WHP78720.1 PfkB family carbohydrate kinase [Edwardsiella anguillarum]WHQ15711.1 PfkB family carbohydrate kinase [Edwardsiella anguillarum]WHQ19491.1 PfkB family carbohydrate kinase [Edwardsiella anguillarum]WHQ23037.1 PfkB family carbohydrate kinase [Edwardsiella anguillarum]WHQ26561.1 PfkB family carbohydrate kinase [Edwardsiella anguillarum]
MTTTQTPRPVAVIGGAVGDLILSLPRLPRRGEDVEAREDGRTIGGCAFNVARALCRLEIPVINGMPVGNGPWGALAEQAMAALALPVLLRHPQQDNGWCLACVEADGERTFISVSGCETQWSAAQLAKIALPAGALVYLSGYELAGDGGQALCEWMYALPSGCTLLLDPGPRLPHLPEALWQRLPTGSLLTLNRDEVTQLCGAGDPVAAASAFAVQRGIHLICRLDAHGAWLCASDGRQRHLPAYPITVADTIGAGDAHCGGVLAGLALGLALEEAIDLGNQVAACVVSQPGPDGAPTRAQLKARFPQAHTRL